MIDDVVVVQRSQMQQLDRRSGTHGTVIGRGCRIGEQIVRQQGQSRTNQTTGALRTLVGERGQFGPSIEPDGAEDSSDAVEVGVQMREDGRIDFTGHARS
ncbi:hypothetical protein [Nocardia beijingensis]|uniref:hypothetical protein n=1 Tax=Nocardia beijingensis TaxID=95162 RepID=UPI0033A6A4A5